MKIPDLLLFECITALVVAHSLLTAQINPNIAGQVQFFSMLLVINLICLLFTRMLFKDEELISPYMENLNKQSYFFVILGVALALMIGIVVSRIYVGISSAIHVAFLDTLSFGGVANFAFVFLYNFALVANAEETTKFVGHNAIYLYLKDRRPSLAKPLAVLLPILFWAVLHAYVAYVGAQVWLLVIIAFLAGLVIFGVMWKTKSLFAAIITHGTYNVVVVSLSGLGLLFILPHVLFFMVVWNLVMLALVATAKRWLK